MLPRAWVIAAPAKSLALAGVAETTMSRMVGLLGRSSLEQGDGLVIGSCRMVHTCFMRFPIDVLFLDTAGEVVTAVTALPPFRLAWGGWRARTTIELPAGTLQREQVSPGTFVSIELLQSRGTQ